MKEKLLQIIFISFALFSCNQNKLINTDWLVVKSDPIPPNNGNTVYDGSIFQFRQNKVILGNIYSDENGAFDIEFIKNGIIINDTILGNIVSHYNDSLIMDLDNEARIKLVNLNKSISSNNKIHIDEHKYWILKNNEFRRDLILSDSIFYDETDSKYCIQKDIGKDIYINSTDKWKEINFNGNHLFAKTLYTFEDEFYRVKKYKGDSLIILESLIFPDVQTSLKKRKYISESSRFKIYQLINDKEWKFDEVLKLDTISRSLLHNQTDQQKLNSLTEISYRFLKDSTYHFYESGKLFQSGNWKVSKTGNEIVLDSGINPTDYVDLKVENNESIIIGKLMGFQVENESWENDAIVYFKVRLTH